jgi:hypothetical protein
MHNTIGVNVKCNLDLRDATRRWWNAYEFKVSKLLVVLGHLTLALQHIDSNLRLVIGRRAEHLALPTWDGCVSFNDSSEDTTESLNSKGEWSNIEKNDASHFALKHTCLDSSAHGNCLIRVYALVRCLSPKVLHEFLDTWHSRHAAYQNNFLDVRLLNSGVLETLLAWELGAVGDALGQLLELGACQFHVEMLWSTGVCCDVWLADFGLCGGAKFDLGLFSCLTNTLDCLLVVGQINPSFLLELIDDVPLQAMVIILATEGGVTVGRFHLEHALSNL